MQHRVCVASLPVTLTVFTKSICELKDQYVRILTENIFKNYQQNVKKQQIHVVLK